MLLGRYANLYAVQDLDRSAELALILSYLCIALYVCVCLAIAGEMNL